MPLRFAKSVGADGVPIWPAETWSTIGAIPGARGYSDVWHVAVAVARVEPLPPAYRDVRNVTAARRAGRLTLVSQVQALNRPVMYVDRSAATRPGPALGTYR